MCTKTIYLCVILLFVCTGFVKGSCLEYGHSCWGAHGKRSGGKIYRSIDGSESQQSEGNRDVALTQDNVKPSDLFSILMERNGRVKLDDTLNTQDLNIRHRNDENLFDVSEQRLKRKLKDALRKGIIFHYTPQIDDNKVGTRSSTEPTNLKRFQRPSNDINNDYQVEYYPSIGLDTEYLDLK